VEVIPGFSEIERADKPKELQMPDPGIDEWLEESAEKLKKIEATSPEPS